jgi:hypothetical protein
MSKVKVFTKADLFKAAKMGAAKGFNRSVGSLKEFKNFVDETEAALFQVTFSMMHEHIAGKPADPHVRAVISFGEFGTVTLDIVEKIFSALPVFDTEKKEFALEI